MPFPCVSTASKLATVAAAHAGRAPDSAFGGPSAKYENGPTNATGKSTAPTAAGATDLTAAVDRAASGGAASEPTEQEIAAVLKTPRRF